MPERPALIAPQNKRAQMRNRQMQLHFTQSKFVLRKGRITIIFPSPDDLILLHCNVTLALVEIGHAKTPSADSH